MILRTVGLEKCYVRRGRAIHALAGVDLAVAKGSFVTITGRSGAGKSTLLLLLGGLIRPTAGDIRYGDLSLTALSDSALATFRREHVGFVMQSMSLVPYLTALQNVEIALSLRGCAATHQASRAHSLLEEVGLADRADHLPRELSVGQQQRVAIARAFANEPDLVFADEPTGNLDPALADDILDLLTRWNREQGTTVVMVTHSPGAAARGSVRVHLEAGRTVSEAPVGPAPVGAR